MDQAVLREQIGSLPLGNVSEVILDIDHHGSVYVLIEDSVEVFSSEKDAQIVSDLILDDQVIKVFSNASLAISNLRGAMDIVPVNFHDLKTMTNLVSYTGVVESEHEAFYEEIQGKREERAISNASNIISLDLPPRSNFNDYQEQESCGSYAGGNDDQMGNRKLPGHQIAKKLKTVRRYYDVARTILGKRNRLDWLDQEYQRFTDLMLKDGDSCFLQVGWRPFFPLEYALLQRLLAFRNDISSATGVPPFSIITNRALLDIVMNGRHLFSDLKKVSGVNVQYLLGARARKLSAIVKSTLEEYASEPSLKSLAPQVAGLVDIIQLLFKYNAKLHDICLRIVANYYEIQDLVRCYVLGQDFLSMPVFSGWRNEIFGQDLLLLLEGKKCFKIEGSSLKFTGF